jgi:hypothetical protein
MVLLMEGRGGRPKQETMMIERTAYGLAPKISGWTYKKDVPRALLNEWSPMKLWGRFSGKIVLYKKTYTPPESVEVYILLGSDGREWSTVQSGDGKSLIDV